MVGGLLMFPRRGAAASESRRVFFFFPWTERRAPAWPAPAGPHLAGAVWPADTFGVVHRPACHLQLEPFSSLYSVIKAGDAERWLGDQFVQLITPTPE